ncbi:2-dehydropantoate 2-reductase [Apilactobacillus apisilvae]|uniref:2-dehydropantoate 2-reductase n=1 Tax=Apilactobacillus apisilvae TaxID=2923364 RepID=A0ABY4PGH7_9LACO|nr:2-dehydropantoate 2-reductase [Apilactobacillus apisilvae]UQS84609.1 2-dehydropantoate 2-reductase [Apilactobacillus apisilvae]
MKYGVIGAGAMGYRYGILLKENANVEVDFIDTWKPNVEKVKSQGGVYVSRDHQNKKLIPINMYYPEEYSGHPDVWIIFKKQMQLSEELERDSKAGLFHKDQYVFSAMNGMGHFEKIDQYFDENHIVTGTAMIATVLNGPGDVDFMGPKNSEAMHMAPYKNYSLNDTTKSIFNDFDRATLGPVMADEWLGMCMTKVIFNAVVNTLCTMFEIRMGELIQYEGVPDMARQLFNESFDACERANIPLLGTRQSNVQLVIDSCHALKYHYPSMYQDFSKGRNTEVDYINGYIAKIGRSNDYICKTHEFVVHEVHLAEKMRQFKK